MSCDVGEATEGLENELCRRWSDKDWSSAHSPNFPSLHLRHSSFSKPFRRFTYVTTHSPTLAMLHLHHSSFSNPSFAFPTSLVRHLRHLASRPWIPYYMTTTILYTSILRNNKSNADFGYDWFHLYA